MLAAEIGYYKPSSIKEAVELFDKLQQENRKPMYYSGGTEIITLGRLNLIEPKSIIDIKGIPECMSIQETTDVFVTGSAISLTVLEDRNPFPLFTSVSSEIADRTARNKITVGGNICGMIFYREAVLPFLLAESQFAIASKNGVRVEPIQSIFNKEIQLKEGEFLVQILTDTSTLSLPFIAVKKRQQWETGYPLITAATLKINGELRFAFSGLCPFPFRSLEMEKELNNQGISYENRIENALHHIPGPVLNDVEGSNDYRLFVLKNTLMDFLRWMEGK
ncbi:FAD binding domain-containing protein [Neobacillus sp. D3-1R]|uniref:FAD binding domain-containing protein n=1 Tax=Neobacillus sp. D3-1R TaxID=3445778 RepID=UPI003FA019A5